MRGMRTLHLRAAAQAKSALGARASASRRIRNVARVLYPGLPQHPGHDVAARQMEGGFGYMLSIQVSGGEARRDRAPRRGSSLWKRATSLGGVESLIEHRASIEGPGHALPAGPAAPVDRHRGCGGLYRDLDEALRVAHA